AIWREALRNDAVGLRDDFFAAGGDSILSIQVVAKAREKGLRLAPRDIFKARTIERLAARATLIGAMLAPAAPAASPPPLTPIEHWFFGLALAEPHHFNQAFLLLPQPATTAERLAAALGRLIARHDALRLRFRRGPTGSWQQSYGDDAAPTVHT